MWRGLILVFCLTILILFAPLSSAGLNDWFKTKITGYGTSGTASVNLTVGNSAPTIIFVQAIGATDPTESLPKAITFNFTVNDADGASNINTTSGKAYFQKVGESTRSDSNCINGSASGNDINFTCTISMWYFDGSGAWTINVTAKDNPGAITENSTTTFTYNVLTSMVLSPTALGWPSVGASSTDVGSNNDPITINNTGNDVYLDVNVTGINLLGEITTTETIPAANFTVEGSSEGCSGTALANATSKNITSAILHKGNNSLNFGNETSGQEQIFFCLKGIPAGISAQPYSSPSGNPWTVLIVT